MTLMTGCAVNVLMSARCVGRGRQGVCGRALRVGRERNGRLQRSELREAQGPALFFSPSLGRFQTEELASLGVWEKCWPLNWYVACCPSLRLSSLVTLLVTFQHKSCECSP